MYGLQGYLAHGVWFAGVPSGCLVYKGTTRAFRVYGSPPHSILRLQGVWFTGVPRYRGEVDVYDICKYDRFTQSGQEGRDVRALQGYLAHERRRPCRTLQ